MTLGAIILAAGMPDDEESFKPMMSIGGKPMVLCIADALRETKVRNIVAVLGYRAEQVQRCLEDRNIKIIINRKYRESKMIDSLKLAMPYLTGKCDRILILPADTPMVQNKTIWRLAQGRGMVSAPCCNGKTGHPIVISATLAEDIASYDGEGGLEGLLKKKQLDVECIEVDDEGVLYNVNTREDYNDALMLQRRREGMGRLHMECSIRLAKDDAVLDTELSYLLRMIGYTQSIQLASEYAGIPYTKAWRAVKKLENELGIQIVESNIGGKKGGGSKLTEQGTELVEQFSRFREEGTRMLKMLYKEYNFDEIVQN